MPMPSFRTARTRRALVLSLFVVLVVEFVPGQARQSVMEKSAQSAKSTAQTSSAGSEYVGSETCKPCHEEVYNSWEKTPHWKTTMDKAGGPSHQGCEGCHGPGADHVAGGGDQSKIFTFKDASRQQTSARCLTCHGDSHAQSLSLIHI